MTDDDAKVEGERALRSTLGGDTEALSSLKSDPAYLEAIAAALKQAMPAGEAKPLFPAAAVDAAADAAASGNQPINQSTDQQIPSQLGDVIESGVYSDPRGDCIVYLDFVSDPLMFAVSRGKRGWASFRTEPQPLTDAQKEEAAGVLDKRAFDVRRSTQLSAELHGQIGAAVAEGNYEGGERSEVGGQRSDPEAAGDIEFSFLESPQDMSLTIIGRRAGIIHTVEVDREIEFVSSKTIAILAAREAVEKWFADNHPTA